MRSIPEVRGKKKKVFEIVFGSPQGMVACNWKEKPKEMKDA